jgi:hypothetical protein
MKLFVSGFFDLTTVSELAGLLEGCGEVTSVRLKKGEKRAATARAAARFSK